MKRQKGKKKNIPRLKKHLFLIVIIIAALSLISVILIVILRPKPTVSPQMQALMSEVAMISLPATAEGSYINDDGCTTFAGKTSCARFIFYSYKSIDDIESKMLASLKLNAWGVVVHGRGEPASGSSNLTYYLKKSTIGELCLAVLKNHFDTQTRTYSDSVTIMTSEDLHCHFRNSPTIPLE
jgi:hypothetical protein